MRTKIADIAKKTGITPGTVSRALSPEGKYQVSPATRKMVADAAAALGYRPNFAGRALAGGASGLVCLLSPLPFNAYYTSVARQLAHHSARQGYCLITDCAYDPQAHDEEATVPRQEWLYGVDGIIACDPAPWHQEYLEEANRLKIPTVSIGSQSLAGSDSVVIGLHHSSRLLVRHLIEQGCTSIAMLAIGHASDGGPRTSAYRAELKEARLPERYVHAKDFSRKDGWEAVMQTKINYDALFCSNDELAIGACRALIERGKNIPGDVAVAGCDGIEETEYINPPLTTMALPLLEVCGTAWKFLSERMDATETDPRVVEILPVLERRASTLKKTSVL